MRSNITFFWGGLACSAVSAVLFTAGWLWNDHVATTGETLLRQGHLAPYDYEWGGMDDQGVAHGSVPESRAWSQDCLVLLKIVPASILAVWLAVSWMILGRDAFRLKTIKSHSSTLK